MIELTQEEAGKKDRNDRLVAVALASLLYADVQDLACLNSVVLKQVERFFARRALVILQHRPDRLWAQPPPLHHVRVSQPILSKRVPDRGIIQLVFDFYLP